MRMSDSLLVAFTVTEVPKHETIYLHRYYWANHIPRICTWSWLVEKGESEGRLKLIEAEREFGSPG
jgi:hypothetical protein